MFLVFYICVVIFGIESVWYCCVFLDVSGAKLIMKKCKRGNGIKFIASLCKLVLS